MLPAPSTNSDNPLAGLNLGGNTPGPSGEAVPDTKGPLQVTLAPGWTGGYLIGKNPPTYSFSGPTDPKTNLGTQLLFSFYQQGNPEQMPSELTKIATGAVAVTQRNPALTVISGTFTKGEINGDIFSGGSATVSWLEKGEAYTHSQTFVIFSDGHGYWLGYYGGPPERWAEALKMIQAFKKN
jgi:hypothetical protein